MPSARPLVSAVRLCVGYEHRLSNITLRGERGLVAQRDRTPPGECIPLCPYERQCPRDHTHYYMRPCITQHARFGRSPRCYCVGPSGARSRHAWNARRRGSGGDTARKGPHSHLFNNPQPSQRPTPSARPRQTSSRARVAPRADGV